MSRRLRDVARQYAKAQIVTTRAEIELACTSTRDAAAFGKAERIVLASRRWRDACGNAAGRVLCEEYGLGYIVPDWQALARAADEVEALDQVADLFDGLQEVQA